MDNKNNFYVGQPTLPLVHSSLEGVYEKVWEQLAAKAIAEIAKSQVRNESTKVLKDFVEFAFDRQNGVPTIDPQLEPSKIKLDEWAVCEVGIDERHSLDSDKRTATIITNSSIKNKKGAGSKTSDQADSKKEEQFVKVVEDPESPQEEEKMRHNYLLEERHRIQSEADRIKREAFEKNQSQLKGKLSKDKKRITFDYDGKVMNLGDGAAPKKALMSTMGMNVNKEEEILKKVDKKKVETEKIQRNTQNFKGEPRRTGKSEAGSKVEFELDGQKNIIDDDRLIENGVKVIELKGDRQTIKQNKPKHSGSFLKYRLQEFKDYIRQRKFKQHSLKLVDEFQRPKPRATDTNITAEARRPPLDQKKKRQQRQTNSITIGGDKNQSASQIYLPQIVLKPNQERSSKYFEEINKDRHKHRVKSVKIDNQHVLSSFYYKNMRNSQRHRNQLRTDSSSININEPVYQQVFEYPS